MLDIELQIDRTIAHDLSEIRGRRIDELAEAAHRSASMALTPQIPEDSIITRWAITRASRPRVFVVVRAAWEVLKNPNDQTAMVKGIYDSLLAYLNERCGVHDHDVIIWRYGEHQVYVYGKPQS